MRVSEASVMERRRIVQFAREHAGAAAALVTLVRAEGSSYRQTGARLLIGAAGEYAGTVSGGCLETEVVRRSVWRVRDGAVVDRYSTEFDDTAEVPYGLGCGGVLDLLLEPAGTAEYEALVEAMERSLRGEAMRVRTWLPEGGRGLRRAVWDEGGAEVFRSEGLASVDADGSVFEEWLRAPQRLVIFGAGDDARPVVEMAALLGWRVVVADGRAQLARAERFRQAERVVAAGTAAEVGVGARDAVVLMTHSYEQDRALLAEVVALKEGPGGGPRYLGLLGARHRSALLVSEAAAMTGRTVAACCEGLYAPVGLDLGGDGPEAIALAVVAEIQACVQGKLGGVRRLTAEEVARQVERGGASRYLQVECVMGVGE